MGETQEAETKVQTRFGFACNWDPKPAQTWSGTPAMLLQAMQRQREVVDLGVHLSRPARRAFQAAYLTRRGGRWHSQWKWSPSWDRYCARTITSRAQQSKCDVVLQVQDLATLSIPFFCYQDLSVDSLLHYEELTGQRTPAFEHLSESFIGRWAQRQRNFYNDAAGVFTMSRWLAQSLVDRTGLAPNKVHVVHPGVNVPVDVGSRPQRSAGERRRLLFVGRDFERKAGPQVVRAFEQLRTGAFPDLTLTICGPERWPMPGQPSQGIDFLGSVSSHEIAKLYPQHDLFVMPSNFEAFGIVFAEALSAGLPCIGRDAWAMPEMIEHGTNGQLISSDQPEELADAIHDVLLDDDIYQNCERNARKSAEHFSWDRAAKEICDQLSEQAG